MNNNRHNQSTVSSTLQWILFDEVKDTKAHVYTLQYIPTLYYTDRNCPIGFVLLDHVYRLLIF